MNEGSHIHHGIVFLTGQLGKEGSPCHPTKMSYDPGAPGGANKYPEKVRS
jgi:hypothetical protein